MGRNKFNIKMSNMFIHNLQSINNQQRNNCSSNFINFQKPKITNQTT